MLTFLVIIKYLCICGGVLGLLCFTTGLTDRHGLSFFGLIILAVCYAGYAPTVYVIDKYESHISATIQAPATAPRSGRAHV